jgi:hypothetical protein
VITLPVIAAGACVVIVALIIGAQLLGDALKNRTQLTREQKSREDAASAANRARDSYERDMDLVMTGFDPIGLFH